MRRVLTIAAVLAALGAVLVAPVPASPPGAVPAKPDAGEFVRRAILDGLTADGVPPALAAALAGNDEDFVPKCAICWPSRQALIEYAKRTDTPDPKPGKGLSENLVKRLMSTDDNTRRVALRELVQRYSEWGFARLEWPAGQKAALQKALEEARKAAMGGLPAGQKFCPSCDGACRLTPKF